MGLFKVKKDVVIRDNDGLPQNAYEIDDARLIDVDFCLSEMGGASKIIIERHNGSSVTYTKAVES